MSYVRWSTKVREGCKTCGDTACVPLTDEDRAELGPRGAKLMAGGRLCPDCTSCWYVYGSVGDFIAVYHGRCSSADKQESWQLSYEEALTWEPPADCPMADVGREAVRAGAADMLSEEAP